ncbi:hypothetical protein IAU60_001372 [Kwoniella sp. DSM 27419]
MSLLATLSSFQTPLTVLLVISGPTLLPRLLSLVRPRPAGAPRRPARPPLSTTTKLLLGIHALWCIAQLVRPPFDLFRTSGLPILASNLQLRRAILSLFGSPSARPSTASSLITSATESGEAALDPTTVHPIHELLLTKLKVLENRYLYARYGHATMTQCMWCHTPEDHLLFSLPGIGSWYVVEGVVIGVLGWKWIAGRGAEHRAQRWRGVMAWVLAGAGVMEVGVKYLWDVRAVNGDCHHLAGTIHTIRTILLFLLPVIYVYLPVAPPMITPSTLNPIISNITSTLRLTTLARKGVQRSAPLREMWSAIGRREADRAEMSRRDEAVREAIKVARVDEGEIRQGAGNWTTQGWRGMVRTDDGSEG